ncbi:nuclear transport factor 2 family protein [Acinetobacter pittii]
MRIIAFLFACLALNSYPAEYIDEQLVLNLLEKEKQSVQNKEIVNFMELLSEDFSGAKKDGTSLTKEGYKEGVIITFMNASKILHNAKIKSLYISENKQSAEVVLESETKFLLERGNYKEVVTSNSVTKSTLILENGTLKYKNSSYIK